MRPIRTRTSTCVSSPSATAPTTAGSEVRPAALGDRLRETVRRLDEPIGDPVTLPNDLMAEACAERGPILLNGEGGDPCLGGPKNVPMLLSRRRVRRQGLLRPEYVDALLAYDRDAVTGRHGLKIWMLMTLSLWHEQVFG